MHSYVSWWNVCCTKLMAMCNIVLSLWEKTSFCQFQNEKKKLTPWKIPAVCIPVCHSMSSHRSPLSRIWLISSIPITHIHTPYSPMHSLLLSTTNHISPASVQRKMMTFHQPEEIHAWGLVNTNIIIAGLTGGGGLRKKKGNVVVGDYMLVVAIYSNTKTPPFLQSYYSGQK